MAKGVAVPYIIALILGIVVIALLGYWFFVLGGSVGGQSTTQQCNTKVTTWCQLWSLNGFNPNSPPTPPGTNCNTNGNPCDPKDTTSWWNAFAIGCSQLQINAPSVDTCKSSFGFGTGGGGGTQQPGGGAVAATCPLNGKGCTPKQENKCQQTDKTTCDQFCLSDGSWGACGVPYS